MKYLLSILLSCISIVGNAQTREDTTLKQLAATVLRLQHQVDSLTQCIHHQNLQDSIFVFNINMLGNFIDKLERRVVPLEQRPYLIIDTKTSRPGVWLTNTAGEYQIFIQSLNYK